MLGSTPAKPIGPRCDRPTADRRRHLDRGPLRLRAVRPQPRRSRTAPRSQHGPAVTAPIPAPRPPIPPTRAGIAAEAKRVVNTRAHVQNQVLDGLARIDALSLRLDDLLAAMKETPA